MNILGISGSPRAEGNTAYVVQYALDALKETGANTQYITLADKDIEPCTGCWNCTEAKQCMFDDDMTEIIEAMRWCNALVLGSPVYMGLVTGQLKVMMDRSVLLRVGDEGERYEMTSKIGCGIACGGFRNGGQELVLNNMHTYFQIHNMRIISDGPRYSHFGATIVGDAEDDELGLTTVRNLAQNIVAALK